MCRMCFRFGCCADGVTAASGPDKAGCGECEGSSECLCADTKFGCCPDGVTAASGPNGAGCEELEGKSLSSIIMSYGSEQMLTN